MERAISAVPREGLAAAQALVETLCRVGRQVGQAVGPRTLLVAQAATTLLLLGFSGVEFWLGDIPHALVLLFTIGGVPSVYAGDEFGYTGVKEDRAGGDDAVRPEFGSPADHGDLEILNLHRYLIGLRRRHPWLHQARTTALVLDNTRYVYETRCGDDALIVALNLGDTPMTVPVSELTGSRAEIIAGTGAPPQESVSRAEVPADGWLVLNPG